MENLFNQKTKIHYRITPSTNGWNVETSKDKKVWSILKQDISLTEAMEFKFEIMNDNYQNLFSKITKS